MMLNIKYLRQPLSGDAVPGSVLSGFQAEIDPTDTSSVSLSTCRLQAELLQHRADSRVYDNASVDDPFFIVVSGTVDGSVNLGGCLDAIAREIADPDNRRTAAALLGAIPEDYVEALAAAAHRAIGHMCNPIKGTMFEFVHSTVVRLLDVVIPLTCPDRQEGSDSIVQPVMADLWTVTERVRTVVATCQFAWVATRRAPISLSIASGGASAVYVNLARAGEEFIHTSFAVSTSGYDLDAYPVLRIRSLDRACYPDGDASWSCQLPPPAYALPEERVITREHKVDVAQTLARVCLWLWPVANTRGDAVRPPESSCCKWDGSTRPYTRGLAYVLDKELLRITIVPNPQSQRRWMDDGSQDPSSSAIINKGVIDA